MKDFFTPTYMFGRFDEITPDFLKEKGIGALLIDIDNTLAPYEQPDPDDRIRAWFASLAENGIKAALVSNNHPPRVERFNRTLGLPAYADSKKPSKKTLLIAMDAIGAKREETAMLGDQLLTDSFAGKYIGLPSIIVPPINDKKNLFFRFKRLCERPFIRKYAKQHGFSESMRFWRIKPTEGGAK
jgi:HAD superfamily phosphatase (TIGR01668 family)